MSREPKDPSTFGCTLMILAAGLSMAAIIYALACLVHGKP